MNTVLRTLTGKTALVTGSGRGIGQAIAMALARVGTNLVLTARTQQEIDQVASVTTDLGAETLAISGDVAQDGTADAAVRAALHKFEAIDILVNNAGFSIKAPVHQTELADWDRVIAVNLRGSFLFVRAVAPQMVERGAGTIIGVSSAAGLRAAPVHSLGAYATSKFGLVGFNESLAESLREFAIRVFTICPGPVNDAGANSQTAQHIPNPRSITSTDVANSVLFAIEKLPLASSGRVIDLYQPTF